jgi:hypothetical protein
VDGSDLLVVELDRERGLGDVDRECAVGVGGAERDALAADDDHAGVAGASLRGTGFCCWPGWRSGGPGALQPGRSVPGWVSRRPV